MRRSVTPGSLSKTTPGRQRSSTWTKVPPGSLWARHRFIIQACIDSACWAAAVCLATLLRWDLAFGHIRLAGLVVMVLFAEAAQVVSGLCVGLYLGRWRFASLDEVVALGRAAVVTSGFLLVVDRLVTPRLVPLSATLGGGLFALAFMAGVRCAWRVLLERSRRPTGLGSTNLLVFGAGDGGVQVITAMMRDPRSSFYPVGLLDDDPSKRHLTILGVKVVGGRAHIARAAETLKADTFLIAIPSADAKLIGELSDLARTAGLSVKVLPSTSELYGGGVGLDDIRDLQPTDLLGRHQIETDIDSIADYLTGQRVLVTGAGGSIGCELCRQIWRFAPAELVMLDRDENALHNVQLLIEGRALLDSPNLVLCNIQDRDSVYKAFARHKPTVVFHAAALKHLPLLERHPAEAIKTNVWGTLNVLDAAADAGVRRFVNISTDKAADPVSVLGYSKRICERMTADVAARTGAAFLSVRFGNVLGSSGSMLKTFRSQIEAGGPVTVTDPEVTRYFMTVAEAVQLVVQAAAVGHAGEALVLDMGAPVRIADVARRLVEQSPRPVEIIYTGLRPGEKCHEVLLGEHEQDARPAHPLISHVTVPPISTEQVVAFDVSRPNAELIIALRSACWARPERSRARLVPDRGTDEP